MKIYKSVARVRAIEPGHVCETYWANQPTSITVIEDDNQHDTGLLDERGNPIVSCEVIGPVGFNR